MANCRKTAGVATARNAACARSTTRTFAPEAYKPTHVR
jgi:hypothetical protein